MSKGKKKAKLRGGKQPPGVGEEPVFYCRVKTESAKATRADLLHLGATSVKIVKENDNNNRKLIFTFRGDFKELLELKSVESLFLVLHLNPTFKLPLENKKLKVVSRVQDEMKKIPERVWAEAVAAMRVIQPIELPKKKKRNPNNPRRNNIPDGDGSAAEDDDAAGQCEDGSDVDDGGSGGEEPWTMLGEEFIVMDSWSVGEEEGCCDGGDAEEVSQDGAEAPAVLSVSGVKDQEDVVEEKDVGDCVNSGDAGNDGGCESTSRKRTHEKSLGEERLIEKPDHEGMKKLKSEDTDRTESSDSKCDASSGGKDAKSLKSRLGDSTGNGDMDRAKQSPGAARGSSPEEKLKLNPRCAEQKETTCAASDMCQAPESVASQLLGLPGTNVSERARLGASDDTDSLESQTARKQRLKIERYKALADEGAPAFRVFCDVIGKDLRARIPALHTRSLESQLASGLAKTRRWLWEKVGPAHHLHVHLTEQELLISLCLARATLPHQPSIPNPSFATLLCQAAALQPGEVVLSPRCRGLAVVREARAHQPAAVVIGVEEFTKYVRKGREQLPDVNFICASPLHLPFTDNSVDVILVNLRNISGTSVREILPPLIKEYERVLAKAGRIVANTSHPVKDFLIKARPTSWYFRTDESASRRKSPVLVFVKSVALESVDGRG